MADLFPKQDDANRKIVATHDYTDRHGQLLFQVVRYSPKEFRQRCPDGSGGWRWKRGPAKPVLYNLPAICDAARTQTIFVVEGEKDADKLASLDLVATCNVGGAGKWRVEYSETLRDRRVVILPDNDKPGGIHARAVAAALHGIAREVRFVELPDLPAHGDVSDWINKPSNSVELLRQLVDRVDPWQPTEDQECVGAGLEPRETGEHAPSNWLERGGIVELIRQRADEPWLCLEVGDSQLIAVRSGGIVTLSGPTGSGKSSLAANIAVRHAATKGPAFLLSREMTSDEMGARMIGMETNTSWEDVLKGHLPDDQMLDALPEQLHIIDRRMATLTALDVELRKFRLTEPAAPILAVIDYGQIIVDAGNEPRVQVSSAWEHADDIARQHRIVILVVSQMSRASSRAARNGGRLGSDAVDGGAETAAIERYSSVVLEIGAVYPEDSAGSRKVALSIAKGRMGGGNRVVPMRYDGRTGRWAIDGDPQPAFEVRAEVRASREEAKLSEVLQAVVAAAARSNRPATRDELRQAAGVGANRARAAIASGLASGVLVEVERKAHRSTSWLIWTPEQAATHNVPLAGTHGAGGMA